MVSRRSFLTASAVLVLISIAAACGSAPQSASQLSSVAPVPSPTPTAERGQVLAGEFGCLACHSPEGNISVGPTWKGLFGKEETLADDSNVAVDESYLRESIVDPNAKVVHGFQSGVMPQDFGSRLTDEQVQSLVEYIKMLR